MLLKEQEEAEEKEGKHTSAGGVEYEDQIILMGHSMGGATLMNALVRNANEDDVARGGLGKRGNPFSKVKGAVVVDVTPLPKRGRFTILKKYLEDNQSIFNNL